MKKTLQVAAAALAMLVVGYAIGGQSSDRGPNVIPDGAAGCGIVQCSPEARASRPPPAMAQGGHPTVEPEAARQQARSGPNVIGDTVGSNAPRDNGRGSSTSPGRNPLIVPGCSRCVEI